MKLTSRSLALAAVLSACSRGPDHAAAVEAARRATSHLDEGRAAVDRLSNGLRAALQKATVQVGATLVAPVDEARVRNTLRDLHDDRTDVGRDLSLYPTRFLAAVGADHHAVAGDRTPDQDYLKGRDLVTSFPCVAQALAGEAAGCVGEMSLGEGQPTRQYLVQAIPTRGMPDGAPNGALVGAITLGTMAKSIRQALDLQTARDRVQLSVGFWYHDRIVPSGGDNDVVQSFLVPDSLVRRLPSGTAAKLATGRPFTFTFDENEGRMQWGAAVGPVPALGPGVGMVIYRAPLRTQ